MTATTSQPVAYRNHNPFALRSMKANLLQFWTLLSKERRENRWLLLLSLPFFALGPIQYLTTPPDRYYSDPWNITVGMFFAAILGIYCGLRDLGRREDFWRSRALSIHQFALAKLLAATTAVALPVLLFGAIQIILCLYRYIPTVPQDVHNYHLMRFLESYLPAIPLICLTLGLSLLLGTLLRKAVDAAILLSALLLLFWLLPLLIPALRFLSLNEAFSHTPLYFYPLHGPFGGWEDTAFAAFPSLGFSVVYMPSFFIFSATLLAIAAAAMILTWQTLLRQWHIAFGQKTLIWSLGITTLLLLGTSGYQLRSNLEPDQELTLLSPDTHTPCRLAQIIPTPDGALAIAADTAHSSDQPGYQHCPTYVFPLRREGNRYNPQPAIPLGLLQPDIFTTSPTLDRFFFSPKHPNRLYCMDPIEVATVRQENGCENHYIDRKALLLKTFALDGPKPGQLLSEIDLLKEDPKADTYRSGQIGELLAIGGMHKARLYRMSDDGLLSLGNSAESMVATDLTCIDSTYTNLGVAKPTGSLPLSKQPTLTPREQLELLIISLRGYRGWGILLDDNTFILDRLQDLSTYNLTSTTDQLAQFFPRGKLRASTLDLAMINSGVDSALPSANPHWFCQTTYDLGLRLYDISSPTPRKTGHFRRPNDFIRATALSPDNTLFAGGKKLYLFHLPSNRE